MKDENWEDDGEDMRKRKETKDKSDRKHGEAKPPVAGPMLNYDGLNQTTEDWYTSSLLVDIVSVQPERSAVESKARKPAEMIRDPYVFEFLGLKREDLYTESQLEQALLAHLQEFLLEMDKGFCFVACQRRVTCDNEHYYIDLLLYNRRLKCLVAIDLMQGRFCHEYATAMNFHNLSPPTTSLLGL